MSLLLIAELDDEVAPDGLKALVIGTMEVHRRSTAGDAIGNGFSVLPTGLVPVFEDRATFSSNRVFR